MTLSFLTEPAAVGPAVRMHWFSPFALSFLATLGLSACAQSTPPVAVSVSMSEATPAFHPKASVRNLHVHTDDMDAMVTKRGNMNGDLAGLRVWRDNGMMHVSFQITNSGSDPLRLLSVESWTDQTGLPIDRRVDEQTIIVPATWTQTVAISAPIPQARNLVLELVAGR